MPMRTILVANHKGGCGKTTLAHHVSVRADERGAKVLAVDTDRQGDLYRRLASQDERSSDRPPKTFGKTGIVIYDPGGGGVQTEGRTLRVIDTPPSASLAKDTVDVIVVPIDGIDAALNANETVADALELKARMVILLRNGTGEGGVRFHRKFAELEQGLPDGVIVCPIELPRGDAIKRTSTTNRPAWQDPYKGAAATAMRDAVDWMLEQIMKVRK